MYGEISSKAGRRHGVGVKGTRHNPPFGAREEPFENKAGRGDQGGVRRGNRGTAVASGDPIDRMQSMGSPGHAGGAPSRGGRVGKGGQYDVDHIDQGDLQRPEQYGGRMPATHKGQVRSHVPGGGKKSPGGANVGRPSSRGMPAAQKAGRQTQWDSAASRRP